MSVIKQLTNNLKFTPASAETNWQRIETLVHGPGAGEDRRTVNSAVFACLIVIATSYPEPPLSVFRKLDDGQDEKLPDHPLQELLDFPTPNGEDEILFWTAWAKHIDGNAYWFKVRSGDAEMGNVVEAWPVSPTLVKPVTKKNSNDWISHYDYHYSPGKIAQVPVSNVIHFRLGIDDRDMRKGISPLKHLVRQISTDEEADKFVSALLANYAVPGLVVIPTGGTNISETDADKMTRKLGQKFGNDNRGNIAVISKESKIEQFGFSPKDLDMTVLHRIPEERISAVMGVPAIMAGLGAGLDRSTYNNSHEMSEWFTERKLIPQWRADAAKLNLK
jgi:HK97 family phage portal protein